MAEALNPAVPSVVSVFAGRIADCGIDPVPLMTEAAKIMRDLLDTRDGATYDFSIEMATTQSEVENGLMFRKHLDADAGMLFYFGTPERETAFWMKDTLIPLDMLFIRADGTVAYTHSGAFDRETTSGASASSVNAGSSFGSGVP